MRLLSLRLAIIGAFLVSGLFAQTPAPGAPSFAVTSVKVNTMDPRQRRSEGPSCSNGRFVALGAGLRGTIMWAFNITQIYQVAGMPQWVEARGPNARATFDIEAKAEGPLSEDQCKLMVQKLLADRFKMAARLEMRELQVYDLVVGKNGPKIKKAADSDKGPGVHVTINGSPAGIGNAQPQGISMQELARFFTGPFLEHPVLDKTGLEGLYRISLDFAWLPRGAPPGDSADLFTAVQQQLGLKLEDHKEPLETVVIDHLERPDAN